MKPAALRKILPGIFSLVICYGFLACSTGKERPYLDAAREAGRWIEASAVETDAGLYWPAVPGETEGGNSWLYSGNSGVVLFFLEMYHTTKEKVYLDAARSGADYLLGGLAEEKLTGLYTGISGIGFTLYETYKSAGDTKYLKGYDACVRFLKEGAVEKGQGVEWSTTTDIIGGTAGTGLFLLYAFEQTQDEEILDLAVRAGRRLIELGLPTEGGLKWAMDPGYPRLMPNFSHGTAGIAYLLSSLYAKTDHQEFLEAAMEGASYLKSIASLEGDGCLIFHHEPEGEDLFYLGWCHGPVGTSRLFYRLYQLTGDKDWLGWIERGAKSIRESGIPEEEHDGFWNNVGVCCGSAGVADYFLSLYEITEERSYLDFALHLTDDLLSRGIRDEKGVQWIQAEHRARPDFLQAQTGLMQGAAGIGLWLLRLDAFDRGEHPRIRFPDNPFVP